MTVYCRPEQNRTFLSIASEFIIFKYLLLRIIVHLIYKFSPKIRYMLRYKSDIFKSLKTFSYYYYGDHYGFYSWKTSFYWHMNFWWFVNQVCFCFLNFFPFCFVLFCFVFVCVCVCVSIVSIGNFIVANADMRSRLVNLNMYYFWFILICRNPKMLIDYEHVSEIRTGAVEVYTGWIQKPNHRIHSFCFLLCCFFLFFIRILNTNNKLYSNVHAYAIGHLYSIYVWFRQKKKF